MPSVSPKQGHASSYNVCLDEFDDDGVRARVNCQYLATGGSPGRTGTWEALLDDTVMSLLGKTHM